MKSKRRKFRQGCFAVRTVARRVAPLQGNTAFPRPGGYMALNFCPKTLYFHPSGPPLITVPYFCYHPAIIITRDDMADFNLC